MKPGMPRLTRRGIPGCIPGMPQLFAASPPPHDHSQRQPLTQDQDEIIHKTNHNIKHKTNPKNHTKNKSTSNTKDRIKNNIKDGTENISCCFGCRGNFMLHRVPRKFHVATTLAKFLVALRVPRGAHNNEDHHKHMTLCLFMFHTFGQYSGQVSSRVLRSQRCTQK